jgi:hypothetical protein
VTSAQPVTVGVHGDSGAGKPSIPEMITIPSAVEAIVQEMITDPIESRVGRSSASRPSPGFAGIPREIVT